MTTVETALGPVATDALGPTLMHEHIVTRSPGVQENWPHLWDRASILALAEKKMADLHARGIRTIVDNEADVLSDDAIAALLKQQGFDVARRTVVKYREAMGIGSSIQRRRMRKIGG